MPENYDFDFDFDDNKQKEDSQAAADYVGTALHTGEAGTGNSWGFVKDAKTGDYGLELGPLTASEDYIKGLQFDNPNNGDKETTVLESLKGTWNNFVGQLATTDDYFNYLSEYLFGDTDSANYQRAVENIDQAAEEGADNQTIGFTDVDDRWEEDGLIGALGGIAAASVNAVSSFAASAVQSATTGGAALGVTMIGGAIKDFNDEKAERLGITAEELIERGQNETFVPATLGAIGYSFERYGLKGVGKAIKGIGNNGARALVSTLNASGKEGGTEFAQGLVEAYNTGLGKTGNAIAAQKEVADFIKNDGLETFLQGAVGGGVSAGGGRLARRAASRLRSNRAEAAIVKSTKAIEAIDTQLRDPNVPKSEKQKLGKARRSWTNKFKAAIKEPDALVRRLDDKQLEEVNKRGEKINDLHADIQSLKGAISNPEAYNAAKEALEEDIQKEVNGINKVVEKQSEKRIRFDDGSLLSSEQNVQGAQTLKDVNRVWKNLGVQGQQEGKQVYNDADTGANAIIQHHKGDPKIPQSKQNKKLRVFDFDDTLFTTEALVHIDSPQGRKTITPEQFATYEFAEGETADFSEFENVKNPKAAKMLTVLDNVVKARGGEGAAILTARPGAAEPAIKALISKLYGPEVADKIKIKGLASSNPQDKADWIANEVANDGYGDVYFTDDSAKNVKAVNDTLSGLPVIYRAQQAGHPDARPQIGGSKEYKVKKNPAAITKNSLKGPRGGTVIKKANTSDLATFTSSIGALWKQAGYDIETTTSRVAAIAKRKDAYNETTKQATRYVDDTHGFVMEWRDGSRFIYINDSPAGPTTAVHEYTHVWSKYMQDNNPELWKDSIRSMFQDKEAWDLQKDRVFNYNFSEDILDNLDNITTVQGLNQFLDLNDQDINDIFDEMLAGAMENHAGKREIIASGTLDGFTAVYNKIIDWVAKTLANISGKEFKKLTPGEFNQLILNDIMTGRPGSSFSTLKGVPVGNREYNAAQQKWKESEAIKQNERFDKEKGDSEREKINNQLARDWQAGDANAWQKLLDTNRGLIERVAHDKWKPYGTAEEQAATREDVIKELEILVIQLAGEMDFNKNTSFSAFLSQFLPFRANRVIRNLLGDKEDTGTEAPKKPKTPAPKPKGNVQDVVQLDQKHLDFIKDKDGAYRKNVNP